MEVEGKYDIYLRLFLFDFSAILRLSTFALILIDGDGVEAFQLFFQPVQDTYFRRYKIIYPQ